MATKSFAVVAGVGPGTGAAVARKFALAYPVVLLARNPENYESLVSEINKSGGKAIGISTDVSNASSVKSAFKTIESEFGGASCAAAVFNASGRFVRKSLLELSEEEFVAGFDVSWYGYSFRTSRQEGLNIDTVIAEEPSSSPRLQSHYYSSRPRTPRQSTRLLSSLQVRRHRSRVMPICHLSPQESMR